MRFLVFVHEKRKSEKCKRIKGAKAWNAGTTRYMSHRAGGLKLTACDKITFRPEGMKQMRALLRVRKFGMSQYGKLLIPGEGRRGIVKPWLVPNLLSLQNWSPPFPGHIPFHSPIPQNLIRQPPRHNAPLHLPAAYEKRFKAPQAP